MFEGDPERFRLGIQALRLRLAHSVDPCAGLNAGLFGYAASSTAPVLRGQDAEITPENVRLSGWLIGEEVPLPVSADEIARLVPSEGKLSIQSLYEKALGLYGNASAKKACCMPCGAVSEKAVLVLPYPKKIQSLLKQTRLACLVLLDCLKLYHPIPGYYVFMAWLHR